MGDRMTFNNSPGVGFPVILRQSRCLSLLSAYTRPRKNNRNILVATPSMPLRWSKWCWVFIETVRGIDSNHWLFLRLQFCSAKIQSSIVQSVLKIEDIAVTWKQWFLPDYPQTILWTAVQIILVTSQPQIPAVTLLSHHIVSCRPEVLKVRPLRHNWDNCNPSPPPSPPPSYSLSYCDLGDNYAVSFGTTVPIFRGFGECAQEV